MADAVPTQPAASDVGLPVPVILVIAIGGYMLVLVVLLIVRQLLMTKGLCSECTPCGVEDGRLQCCNCWLTFAESCNCCSYPNLKTCMDSVCGNTKRACTIEKCITFQTCTICCGPESGCECAGCDCACQPPECDSLDCLCFKMQLH